MQPAFSCTLLKRWHADNVRGLPFLVQGTNRWSRDCRMHETGIPVFLEACCANCLPQVRVVDDSCRVSRLCLEGNALLAVIFRIPLQPKWSTLQSLETPTFGSEVREADREQKHARIVPRFSDAGEKRFTCRYAQNYRAASWPPCRKVVIMHSRHASHRRYYGIRLTMIQEKMWPRNWGNG